MKPKTFILISFFSFLIVTQSIIYAQENENNYSQFPIGSIIASENATAFSALRLANTQYDYYIIGIFCQSGKTEGIPALIKHRPVASTGICELRYNSENGPIKKGDLITSSSKPGEGMKATQSGMVVGIAMEDAAAPSGLIKCRILIQYVKQ